MWYHQLLNSEEERHATKVLRIQMAGENNWFTELQQYANTNDITIDEEHVTTVTYTKYKEYIKQKIRTKVDQELATAQKTKTKLRWIKPGKIQNYLRECTIGDAIRMMKLRLHMGRIRANYGGGVCRKCEIHEETTEHIINACLMD